jgi:adenine-specific DNA methylase
LRCTPSAQVPLKPESLDGVFTDPPYFDNVQYAELMDFCYVWLRRALAHEFEEFRPHSTQSSGDLTGNKTLGRGLEHFAEGLSEVFSAYARALKPGAPFVFTYHHNNPEAYAL